MLVVFSIALAPAIPFPAARAGQLSLQLTTAEQQATELAAAFLDGTATFSDFAAAVNASSLQPRMLVSEGCSGSTEGLAATRAMIAAHGRSVRSGHGSPDPWQGPALDGNKHELFKCSEHGLPKGCDITEAIRRQVAKNVKEGAVLVFKASTKGDAVPETWGAMRALGAHAAVMWRSNTLARVLCDVRDCFRSPTYATLVGAHTDACFSRRELPSDEQPKVHAASLLPPPLHPRPCRLTTSLRPLHPTPSLSPHPFPLTPSLTHPHHHHALYGRCTSTRGR